MERASKINSVIAKIAALTGKDALLWKEGPGENAFSVALTHGYVMLSREREGFTHDAYTVTILDNDGRELEVSRFSSSAGNAFKDVAGLYEAARRSALAIDANLDDILRDLDELD